MAATVMYTDNPPNTTNITRINHHPLIRRDTPAQAAELYVRPVLYFSNDLRHKFSDHAVSV